MPRAGLTRDRVVDEAVTLVDDADLSLAVLADRLGVRVPSLYKHVDGLDDVTRAAATRCVRELTSVMRDAAVGVARDDAVRAVAIAYRRWAHEHPGRYRLAQRAPAPDDVDAVAAAGEAVDVVASALAGFRLDADHLVDAVRGLRACIHGFVSLEAAGGFGMPRSTDSSFDALIDALLGGYASAGSDAATRA